MKASVCLAAVFAVVVIQMVNAQHGPVIHPASDPLECPRCDAVCLSGSVDKNETIIGCAPCECPPTCANFSCSNHEKCVLEQVICVRVPCYPLPNCVPINETTTTTITPPATNATQICMEMMCMVGCEWIPVAGQCPICECQTNCTAVTCPVGFECQMAVVSCFKAPCPESHAICLPIKNTTQCPVYKCKAGCVSDVGPDGCHFCRCPPTCEDMKCTEDEECVLKPLIDCWSPCFPLPTCVPANVSCTGTPNTDECGKPIESWFYNESTHSCQSFRYSGCNPSPNTFQSLVDCNNKCWDPEVCVHCGDDCKTYKKVDEPPKCICPDPCKGFNCTADEVCRLTEAVCIMEPCKLMLVPYCDKNRCPRQPPCNIRCAYGLKTDGNGCPLCKCCEEAIEI